MRDDYCLGDQEKSSWHSRSQCQPCLVGDKVQDFGRHVSMQRLETGKDQERVSDKFRQHPSEDAASILQEKSWQNRSDPRAIFVSFIATVCETANPQ